MVKKNIDMDELQKKSEKLFQDFCDNSNLQWLYIAQDKSGKFSRALYKAEGKRPDFLVTIPSLGTVFFDVKAKEDVLFYEKIYRKSVPGFNIDSEDFQRLERLQEQTTINVWYAIFPHLENKLMNNCFVAPLNVISRFVRWEHITNPKWTYVQVPKQCFNDYSKAKKIELKVKCEECSFRLCKEFQDRIKRKER